MYPGIPEMRIQGDGRKVKVKVEGKLQQKDNLTVVYLHIHDYNYCQLHERGCQLYTDKVHVIQFLNFSIFVLVFSFLLHSMLSV